MPSRSKQLMASIRDWFEWGIQTWLRDRRSPDFIQHHHAAMSDVLGACSALKLKYWAIEGTLISLLRYGNLGHPGENPSIDDDIDLMVAHSCHEEWIESALALRKALQHQGWEDAFHTGPLLSTSTRPGARTDKLKLRKFSPHSRRVWTHLDLHSGIIDGDQSHLMSHPAPDEYPFQKWQGRLPREWIFPLRTARCDEITCPVPQRSIELLACWHNGEYEASSLLYPLHPISDAERQKINQTVTALDQAGYASFAPLLGPAPR